MGDIYDLEFPDGYDDYHEADDCEQYDDCDDDSPDYDYAAWPDPDPSLIARLKRFINRWRWRFYSWLRKGDANDIPF